MALTDLWATNGYGGGGAGGAKYGVNLGIFKNHSGGARGGQISPDRSQIYIHDGGSPLRNSA